MGGFPGQFGAGQNNPMMQMMQMMMQLMMMMMGQMMGGMGGQMGGFPMQMGNPGFGMGGGMPGMGGCPGMGPFLGGGPGGFPGGGFPGGGFPGGGFPGGGFPGGPGGPGGGQPGGGPWGPSGPLPGLGPSNSNNPITRTVMNSIRQNPTVAQPGYCYRGVKHHLNKAGVNLTGGSAYMAADQLARDNRFQEIRVPRDQLRNLPEGAIVVWNRGAGKPHGHISIATGDGREASDRIRNQMTNYPTQHRVFVPR